MQPELPDVLHNLTFEIRAGEKVTFIPTAFYRNSLDDSFRSASLVELGLEKVRSVLH